MNRILAITNQKGGVGKTTTSVNLAASLAAEGRRVLLIDLDPQGHATLGSGVGKQEAEPGAADVLLGACSAEAAIRRLSTPGYSLMPGNGRLTVAEVQLLEQEGREYRLRDALAIVADRYDYVLIDGPPALNTLTVNALVAARGGVMRMQCEFYALDGLSELMDTIQRIRAGANPGLRIAGLLRTMYDPRNNLASDVSERLISHFGEQVFGAVIPRNVRLAEAPSHGLPVLYYDKSSRGAMAYSVLATELVARDARIFA